MTLLSYFELLDLVDSNVIGSVDYEAINATSIDIHLGKKILWEDAGCPRCQPIIDYSRREPVTYNEHIMDDEGWVLEPGDFILAQSVQVFNLPDNISAEYKLKSSMARIGLEHMNAGWCDAGWNGSVLTLELKNMTQFHNIRIRPGDPIGQMIFFRHHEVPANASYASRGRYNGDTEVKGIKK